MIQKYTSKLNKFVTHTATFSKGNIRFGWAPHSYFQEQSAPSLQDNCASFGLSALIRHSVLAYRFFAHIFDSLFNTFLVSFIYLLSIYLKTISNVVTQISNATSITYIIQPIGGKH